MSAIDPINRLKPPFQSDNLISIKLNLFTQSGTNCSSFNLQLSRTSLGQIQALTDSRLKDCSKKYNAALFRPTGFVVTETAVKTPSKKELFYWWM